jgi:hypothetical protein
MSRVRILLAVIMVAGACGRAWAEPLSDHELVIETKTGSHRFSVELAQTAEERAEGLMFRRRLAADAGMLFVYPSDQTIHMWMKNTLIPLDMLFIAADGRITRVAERTVPGSTAVISSGAPARGVLEVNGGTAARLGIAAGDRVIHPAFQPAD